MSSATIAVLPWLVMVFLPGFAVLRLIRFPGSLGILLASAAPVSLGLVYLVGLTATRAGVSVQLSCLAVLLAVVLAWLVVELSRFRSARDSAVREPGVDAPPGWAATAVRDAVQPWREPARATGRVLALVAVALGMLLWHQVHSKLTVPSGWDVMHHAYFVRQISTHDTLSSPVVLSTEPGGPADGVGFYPLAMNLVAALIHVSTGLRISAILLASSFVLVGVALPLAVYGLVRRMLPDRPVTAGFAAIASVLPALLYVIEYTGRVTDVQGLALVPAAMSLMIAFGLRFDWRLAIAGPLALIGVIGLHTSELPIVAGLVLAFVIVEAMRRRVWRPAGVYLLYAAGVGAVAWLVLLLTVPGIGHLISQRSGSFGPAHGGNLSFTQALRYVTSLPQWGPVATRGPMHIWVIAALIGCALILALPGWRRLAPVAIGYLAYAAFYTAWVFGHVGPFAVFADAWYRVYTRMQWEFCVLGAIPVGVTLAVAAALVQRAAFAIRRPSAAPSARGYRIAAGLAAAVAAGAIAWPMIPPVNEDARWLRANASPIGKQEQAAFRYLQQHVLPGQRVLDDLVNHGDSWMFADYGVANMFGNPPPIGSAPASWKDRLYLRARLHNIESDGCVNQLLKNFDVGWVYYSTHRLSGGKIRITLRALQSTPAFHLAFRSGGAYVFRIDRTGLPQRCDNNVATPYPWSTFANSN